MAKNPILVSWDTETHLILHGLTAPPPVCVTFAWHGAEQPEPLRGFKTHKDVPKACIATPEQGALALAKLGSNPDVVCIGHNSPYDCVDMAAKFPELLPVFFRLYREGRMACTKVRQQLIDLAAGNFNYSQNSEKTYSLADLSLRHTKKKLEKEGTWRMRYAELDGVPLDEWPEEALVYPLKDAATTMAVFLGQVETGGRAFVREENGKKVRTWRVNDEDRQERADFALALTAAWGMTVDDEMLEKCLEAAKKTEQELFFQLRTSRLLKTDGRVNLKVVQQRVEEWYESHGMAIPRTESGAKAAKRKDKDLAVGEGVSYSRDTLLTTDDKDLHLLADLMRVRKEMDTFLGPIKRKSCCRWDAEELKDLPGQVACNGCKTPVTPTYRVLVANGRCSCVSPNMQQLPKDGDVRGCFVSRAAYALLSCDYDTLELRTLAQACLDLIGESRLAEELRKPGADVHCLMASNLTGIPYETLVKWRKEKTPEWEQKGDHARRLAKIANFGLGGGMAAEALKGNAHDEGIELSLAQCKDIIRGWHKTWPEMAKYFAYCEKMAPEGSEYGDVIQLRSKRLRANVGYTERCNTFFSGLAGDGAKEALWEVCCECYLENPWGDGPTALFGSRACGFIHDEIIVETPDDEDLTEVGKRLGEVMCRVMQRWVPDVPITATAAAMRRWSKKADTVMVDGKLVCWEDRPQKKAV